MADHVIACRRATLAGLAGFTIGGAAIVAPATASPSMAIAAENPDADLVRLCSEFDAIQQAIDDLYRGPGRIDDDGERGAAIEPLSEAQGDLLDALCDMRARTQAGFIARARTLAKYNPDLVRGAGADCSETRQMAALLRDMTAG